MNNLHSTAAGYTVAAIIAIIANTLLVFAKETNPALLAAMKSIAHHWFVHGVVIVLLFILLGLLFSRWPVLGRLNGTFLSILLTLATIASGIGIAGFFLLA
ncbi:hypothetical protein HY418_01580 [Candidatus Kaiserbacteria bacterium]|nr:hypothetical protein [Candidatus Kaiserbacteria bacterium]